MERKEEMKKQLVGNVWLCDVLEAQLKSAEEERGLSMEPSKGMLSHKGTMSVLVLSEVEGLAGVGVGG